MFRKLVHKIKVLTRWARIWSYRIVHFFTHDIWYLNEESFTKWKGRFVRDAKTAFLMMNTFTSQKIGYQIKALAYKSMLAVVPAIAMGFYLTDGVGMRDKFAEVLTVNLGDLSITESLLTAADNIVSTAHSGLFGFISMASFVWIIISLMMTVRRVFNNVWKVEKEKNFMGMIGVIIGITILAPFVIILFFTGSVVYSSVLDLIFPSKLYFSEHLKSFASWVMFAGMSILILWMMYKYIPGTKVRSKYAMKAAILSGLSFTLIQYLYLETQVMVAKQSAVYGVLAAVPLFMIWLNMGWSIILYGAELSYAFQNVEKYKLSIQDLDKMNEDARRERRERLQNTMKI